MSKSSRKKLRIGLLLDSYNVPHWVHLMLKEIINSESTEICLTILNKHSSEKRAERGNFFQRMYQNRKNLLYLDERAWWTDELHFLDAGWIYHFNAIPQNPRHAEYWMKRTYEEWYG